MSISKLLRMNSLQGDFVWQRQTCTMEKVLQLGWWHLVAQDANEANHLMSGTLVVIVRVDGRFELWNGRWRMQKVGRAFEVERGLQKRRCSWILHGYVVWLFSYESGGALSIACASRLSSSGVITAAAPFYGIPPLNFFPVTTIKCPLLLSFGKEDTTAGFSDPKALAALEAALKEAKVDFISDSYPCGHAFMNKTRAEAYHEQSAKLAFTKCVGFFNDKLKIS